MSENKKKFKEAFTIWSLTKLLSFYFFVEKFLLKIKHINYPECQFILSMWHSQLFSVYGVKDKEKFYTLISASNDGEIIAKSAMTLGIKSVRGSSKRRGAAASLALIEKLNEGNSAAITVDGPRGPKEKVKEGIVQIASLTGVPVVPMSWFSKDKSYVRAKNTWDNFVMILGYCKSVALYGNPVYIPKDLTKEQIKEYCLKIEEEMIRLEKDLEENFDKYATQD